MQKSVLMIDNVPIREGGGGKKQLKHRFPNEVDLEKWAENKTSAHPTNFFYF
jgi:hypothetical protein